MAGKQKGRPKKNPEQPMETALNNAPEVKTEETVEIKKVSNPKVDPKPDNPLYREDGGIREYLVIKDGHEVYYTAATLEVVLKTSMANNDPERPISFEIPKGSPYVIPEELKGGCKGCG